jgi:ATP/maltotriose-dependent transcriptional regulator MalT
VKSDESKQLLGSEVTQMSDAWLSTELRRVRNMARDAEASLAHPWRQEKASAQRQPRSEFENILAEILVSREQAPNPLDVLQTIEQTMAQAVRPSDASTPAIVFARVRATGALSGRCTRTAAEYFRSSASKRRSRFRRWPGSAACPR